VSDSVSVSVIANPRLCSVLTTRPVEPTTAVEVMIVEFGLFDLLHREVSFIFYTGRTFAKPSLSWQDLGRLKSK
jgi:hypothetical protein